MTLRASVAACPFQTCISLSLQVAVWYFRLPVSFERALQPWLPYMQTHFSFDSSPWVWAALSPVHPSLCWRNKHHMHWVNLSSPSCSLNVPCTYFSYKLCLNPLVGHAEWPFSVLRPETQIPVGTIMVPFLLVIFFLFSSLHPTVQAEPISLPPLLLLLLPAASSSSLTSVPNTVNSEALCAAVVASLQAKAKSLWNISLCMVLTELAPSFFGWPEETRGRRWLVLSAAYAAFKYS